MISTGVFITGTDTGIGKTVITTGLALSLNNLKKNCVYMKPVQTGVTIYNGNIYAPDLAFYHRIADIKFCKTTYSKLNPYLFENECSPHLAARLSNKNIELHKIVDSYKELKSQYDITLIEGAGGLLVPLNDNETSLDLIKLLNIPVIIVSENKLGMINHTLLTIERLRHADIPVAGVIINQHNNKPSYIQEDNVKAIIHYGMVDVLGIIPTIEKPIEKEHLIKLFSECALNLLSKIDEE